MLTFLTGLVLGLIIGTAFGGPMRPLVVNGWRQLVYLFKRYVLKQKDAQLLLFEGT